jgi:hypothetical protein
MVAVAGLALLPSAAAGKAHRFRIAGATAQAKAVEDAVLKPIQDGGQNDTIHAEFTISYRLVLEKAGVFKAPVLSVPSQKSTRVLIKGETAGRGNGQTWLRDHYATWSCQLKPHRFKTIRDYVVAGGTVKSQIGESFAFAVDEDHCQASEQGALPDGIGTTAGKRLAPEMLITHAFSAAELSARKRTVQLAQSASGPIDCKTLEMVSCTDTASASGTLKLARKRH